MFEDNKDLRADVVAYLRQAQQPAPASAPRPPGITADMKPEVQDAACELYAGSILAKPASALTPQEREFLRLSIAAYNAS